MDTTCFKEILNQEIKFFECGKSNAQFQQSTWYQSNKKTSINNHITMKKVIVLLLIFLLSFVVESRIQNLKKREELSRNSKKSQQSDQKSKDDQDKKRKRDRKSKKSKKSKKSMKSKKNNQRPVCGNGKLEKREMCEIGTEIPDGFLCENCQLVEISEPVCGDGVIEGSEQCEGGIEIPEGHRCQNCQLFCDCPQNFNYYPCLEACSTAYMEFFSCGQVQCLLTSCPLPSNFQNKLFQPLITDQMSTIMAGETESELQSLKTHQDFVFYVEKAPLSVNIKVGSSQLATDLQTLVYGDAAFTQALQDCTGTFPIFSGETPQI